MILPVMFSFPPGVFVMPITVIECSLGSRNLAEENPPSLARAEVARSWK